MPPKKYHLFMAHDRNGGCGANDYEDSFDYLADAKARVAGAGAWWADVMIIDKDTGGLRTLEEFHISDVGKPAMANGWRVVQHEAETA